MTEYYFLGTLLAPLSLDQEPDVNFEEFKELARIDLSKRDQIQVRLFLNWIDLNNLSALWSGQPITLVGNYTKEELGLLQKEPLSAPSYLETFLHKYRDNRERAAHFDQLLLSYFSYAHERATGFLKEYLEYEQVLRIAVAARRAVKLQRTFEDELALLDPTDPWQAELQTIAHGEPDISGLQEEVHEILDLYDSDFQSPIDLFKQLLLLRFDKIEKFRGHYSPFSVDAIIAYAAQLELVNKWQRSGKVKDQSKVMTILKDIKHE